MSKNEKNYTRRILQMAADIGVSIIEVAAEFEWEPSQASSRLGSLVRQGRLVKAIPAGSSRARYYLVAPTGSLVEDVADPDEKPQTSIAASTPPWVHDRQERVTYRNGIKVTIGPSTDRDTRVQCAADERVDGAGFVKAGIWNDVTTGKAWEDRK